MTAATSTPTTTPLSARPPGLRLQLAMAADAANSAGPADILASAGIGGQDPAHMPPQPPS